MKLHVWELSGDEKFMHICSTYLKGSHILVAIFDLTNRKSFDNIESRWVKFVQDTITSKVISILVYNSIFLYKPYKCSRQTNTCAGWQ